MRPHRKPQSYLKHWEGSMGVEGDHVFSSPDSMALEHELCTSQAVLQCQRAEQAHHHLPKLHTHLNQGSQRKYYVPIFQEKLELPREVSESKVQLHLDGDQGPPSWPGRGQQFNLELCPPKCPTPICLWTLHQPSQLLKISTDLNC